MEMETLKDLYIEGLKDLYSAENQIIKAMPKMIKKASHRELQMAFTRHLRETERQAKRLERILRQLGEKPGGKKCHGMEGLIDEAKELIDEKPAPDVLDAGLIAKAQHVEHYEIAGYGTMRTYARLLGYGDQADLLQQTLDEEGATDHLLTALAEKINIEAETPDEDEGEDEEMPARRGGRKSSGRKGGVKKASGAKRATRKSTGGRRRSQTSMLVGG